MQQSDAQRVERLLAGFVPAGTLLVVASWLITGKDSVGLGIVPLLLLGWVWFDLRRRNAAEDQG